MLQRGRPLGHCDDEDAGADDVHGHADHVDGDGAADDDGDSNLTGMRCAHLQTYLICSRERTICESCHVRSFRAVCSIGRYLRGISEARTEI